jgi:hypothetical protein
LAISLSIICIQFVQSSNHYPKQQVRGQPWREATGLCWHSASSSAAPSPPRSPCCSPLLKAMRVLPDKSPPRRHRTRPSAHPLRRRPRHENRLVRRRRLHQEQSRQRRQANSHRPAVVRRAHHPAPRAPFLAYQGGTSTTTTGPWRPPSPSPAPSALPLLARAPRRRRQPWYVALSPSPLHSPNPSLPTPLLAPLPSPLVLPISCRIFFFQHKLRAAEAAAAATKPTPALGRGAPQHKSGGLLGVGTLRFLAQGPKGGGSSVWRCQLLCFLLLLMLAICPHLLLSLFAASIQFVTDPASVVPSSQEAPLLSLFDGRLLHPIRRRSGSCQEAPARLPLSVLHCCWPCVLRRIPAKR